MTIEDNTSPQATNKPIDDKNGINRLSTIIPTGSETVSQLLYTFGVLTILSTFGIIFYIIIFSSIFDIEPFYSTDIKQELLRQGGYRDDALIDHWIATLAMPVIFIIISLLAVFTGYLLLRAAGSLNKQVLPREEYPILAEALLYDKTKTIEHYIKLSSLTGVMGKFTQLGLSGLPLATILITLFFALLSIWVADPEKGESFFDLAKLTLGAFLGSYVQRQIQTEPSQTVRPTGVPSTIDGQPPTENERVPPTPRRGDETS